MHPDIESLNKSIIFPKTPDAPDLVYVAVEQINPPSLAPVDQFRLEPYVRIKALPPDTMRLVTSIIEGQSISAKVSAIVPDLGVARLSYYPNGIVELQWPLDDGSIFGLILKSFSSKLVESNGSLSVERHGKITWRYHGPKSNPQHGEFANVEELLDFVSKSFVTRE